ncbi:MAG: MBL fold metallo-hydrolase [Burkholderiaceae bacterium]
MYGAPPRVVRRWKNREKRLMQFASLGSGSEGNGLLVRSCEGTVLIDCGFGLKACRARMQALDVDPDSLAAILVTHEHADHIGGVFRLAVAHRIPVYLTHGTLHEARVPEAARDLVRPLVADQVFELAGLQVHAVPVPHDAREPVQFVIDSGKSRLGVLTDLGHGSAHVIRAFQRLDALVLECNHDPAMLADNPRYPASLKKRIGGPFGHLSNQAAADILSQLEPRRLKRLVAAHLSAHNNTPALARAALAAAMSCAVGDIEVADQAQGLAWSDTR